MEIEGGINQINPIVLKTTYNTSESEVMLSRKYRYGCYNKLQISQVITHKQTLWIYKNLKFTYV
jgi:hypothetical protein